MIARTVSLSELTAQNRWKVEFFFRTPRRQKAPRFRS